MVLKEKKPPHPKRSPSIDDSASLLSQIEHLNFSHIFPPLQAYLDPVLKLQDSIDKENTHNTEKHRIAKKYVPFLAQLLKLCSSALSKLPVTVENEVKSKADELFSCMSLALDCFECLRHWLVGCPFEIEIQRSCLVRRLMAWKRFLEAFNQDMRVIRSLCIRAFRVEKAEISSPMQGLGSKEDKLTLPSPDRAQELTQALVVLVIGAATDLVVCAGEIGTLDSPLFAKVLAVSHDLEPWLSELEPEKLEKQRALLFRGLHKCLMAAMSDYSQKQQKLVEALCSQTLHECAVSCMRDHFCKIARSVCMQLCSQGPEIAIDVGEEALVKFAHSEQLQRVCCYHEVVDLIECYARLCQTAKRFKGGWCHISKAIGHAQQDSAASVGGLYAVALVLDANFSDILDENINSELYSSGIPDCKLAHKACKSLESAIEAAEKALARIQVDSRSEFTGGTQFLLNECKLDDKKEFSKGFSSMYRALDFVRRSAANYAQRQWEAFIAKADNLHSFSELNCALERCLILFCQFVNVGLRCSGLSPSEREVFQRGSKSIFLARTSALRLSLLENNKGKESATLIIQSISDPFVRLEELQWLMSSSYNMGVQLFNLKLHDLACEPFRVSYAAAWARAACIHTQHVAGKPGSVKASNATTDLEDALADAYAKSSVLIDTLSRTSNCQVMLDVFCDSIRQWARIGSIGSKKSIPCSLLQLWFKKVLTDSSGKSGCDMAIVEGNMICTLISGFNPPLPADDAGLLLEEELLLCGSLEESEPNLSLSMKQRILDVLLDSVYTEKSFLLQRSKVLVEKGRISRLHNQEGSNGCLVHLTQAICILEEHLHHPHETGDGFWQLDPMKAQLATEYFLRALCSQEVDPQTKDFSDDISHALELWEGLFLSCKSSSDQRATKLYQLLTQLESTGLLQNVADLLALKGYSTLQYRVYGLVLDIASATQSDIEGACAAICEGGKMSHVLCHSPLLHELPYLLTQKLGLDCNSTEFWQSCAKKDPDGVLPILLKDMFQDVSKLTSEESYCDDSVKSSWAEIVYGSHDSKADKDISKWSQACFMLAHSSANRGRMQEALHNAKEGLRLRLKLLNRHFKLSAKLCAAGSKTETCEVKHENAHLEALGCVAVSNWPTINTCERSQKGPSQWRIIGDYLESLMQVGVYHERLGAVDDGERSFREGCQIASFHHLPLAKALFNSCLGEVQRKRCLWKQAEHSFETASCIFNHNEMSFVCKHCRQLGEATLDFRVGDLVRRRTDNSVESSIETLRMAIKAYKRAEKNLSVIMLECSENSDGQDNSENQKVSSGLQDGHRKSNNEKDSVDNHIAVNDDQKLIKNRLRSSARTENASAQGSVADLEDEILENLCEAVSLVNRESFPADLSISVPSQGWRSRNVSCANHNSLPKTRNGNTRLSRFGTSDDKLCTNVTDSSPASNGTSARESKVRRIPRKQTVAEGVKRPRKPTARKGKGSHISHLDEGLEETNEVHGTVVGERNNHNAEERKTVKLKPVKEYDELDSSSSDKTIKTCLCVEQNRNGKPSSLHEWINSKWDESARRLMARVFLQKGKCLMGIASAHEVHENFLRALFVLKGGDHMTPCLSYTFGYCQLECISLKQGSSFYPMEEGCLLYHLSMLILKQNCRTGLRDKCCHLSNGGVFDASIWLMRAFILCSELPPLLRKVARMLAILHVPQESGGLFATSVIHDVQPNQLASYFHQASLGSSIRQQHLSTLDAKVTSVNDQTGSGLFEIEASIARMQQALRISPQDLDSLKSSIEEDIQLPCSTVCISLVDQETRLLFHGLNEPLDRAWFLISRFDTGTKPWSMIFHSDPSPEGISSTTFDTLYSISGEGEAMSRNSVDVGDGKLPFVETQVEKFVCEFRKILDESCQSTSGAQVLSSLEEKSKWWEWRADLNSRLASFLRTMEEIWLGPWKCVLLGNYPSKGLNAFRQSAEELKMQMESILKYPVAIDVSLLGLLLQGAGSLTRDELERGIIWLLGRKDSVLCSTKIVEPESAEYSNLQAQGTDFINKMVKVILQLFHKIVQTGEHYKIGSGRDAKSFAEKQSHLYSDYDSLGTKVPRNLSEDFENVDKVDVVREPVALVLDASIQALPWESLPTLRKEEFYRMPSLGSMRALMIQRTFLEKSRRCNDVGNSLQREARNGVKEKTLRASVLPCDEPSLGTTMGIVPTIDPRNTYFLLNPSGDLGSTQAAFEDWFKSQQGWEGKSGEVPTIEEYMHALQTHDLFVYFGHGSGDQYFPERRMRKMDVCAAALLMGCSSGRLLLRGDYEPAGVPWSYLMSGCPAAIANLWDVTDGDIDRFSRVLLHKWVDSDTVNVQAQIAFNSKSKDCGKKQVYKGKKRKEVVQLANAFDALSLEGRDPREVRIASHIGEGRNSCKLPYLIGASPVCYGIPTLIRKNILQ